MARCIYRLSLCPKSCRATLPERDFTIATIVAPEVVPEDPAAAAVATAAAGKGAKAAKAAPAAAAAAASGGRSCGPAAKAPPKKK